MPLGTARRIAQSSMAVIVRGEAIMATGSWRIMPPEPLVEISWLIREMLEWRVNIMENHAPRLPDRGIEGICKKRWHWLGVEER